MDGIEQLDLKAPPFFFSWAACLLACIQRQYLSGLKPLFYSPPSRRLFFFGVVVADLRAGDETNCESSLSYPSYIYILQKLYILNHQRDSKTFFKKEKTSSDTRRRKYTGSIEEMRQYTSRSDGHFSPPLSQLFAFFFLFTPNQPCRFILQQCQASRSKKENETEKAVCRSIYSYIYRERYIYYHMYVQTSGENKRNILELGFFF